MKNLTQKSAKTYEETTVIITAATFVITLLTGVTTEIFNKSYFMSYIQNYVDQVPTLGLIAFTPLAGLTLIVLIAHIQEPNNKETAKLLNKFLILGNIVFWAYNTVIYITL